MLTPIEYEFIIGDALIPYVTWNSYVKTTPERPIEVGDCYSSAIAVVHGGVYEATVKV